MLFRSDRERDLAAAIAGLNYANPFLPERVALERAALGDDYSDQGQVWHGDGTRGEQPNVKRIQRLAETLTEQLRRRLDEGARPDPAEAKLYADIAVYLLYNRYEPRFYELIENPVAAKGKIRFFDELAADAGHFLGAAPATRAETPQLDHLFALFFQVRRAFHHVFGFIIGGSMPTARLRAALWQSVFTHDIKRYRRGLYRRMGDVATLITGPSGTGKELAAQAVALSGYIPFDAETRQFAAAYGELFFPLNLSALSPTLIESELFGHRRGAFTGAISDRKGWMETCPALGSVFLDEIGEVEPTIQVKLLRVLQNRSFQRLGESKERRFDGKVIAATNRDLAAEMASGRFREDLYYRLCSDLIETPSLAAQLADDPAELKRLLRHLAAQAAGEPECRSLAGETARWIERELGADYPWPGNVRELAQCVRNVMIRGAYRPKRRPPAPTDPLDGALLASGLTADGAVRRYCRLVYAETRSYRETARRLDLDWRTVKAKVND